MIVQLYANRFLNRFIINRKRRVFGVAMATGLPAIAGAPAGPR